jgi:hypothetical protein
MNRSFASACVFDERMTRITSSMFAWASSKPFDGVLALASPREQELRPPADDGDAMPDELLEHLLEMSASAACRRPAPAG